MSPIPAARHTYGCTKRVPPKMFMCRKHWYMVPKALRDAVWQEYVAGQEVCLDPSPEYLAVTQRAVNVVAGKEGKQFKAARQDAFDDDLDASMRRLEQLLDAADRRSERKPKRGPGPQTGLKTVRQLSE